LDEWKDNPFSFKLYHGTLSLNKKGKMTPILMVDVARLQLPIGLSFFQELFDGDRPSSPCGIPYLFFTLYQNQLSDEERESIMTQTSILHAQRRWPDAINTHLWTYAIRAANDSRNYAPTNEHDTSPMSRFCATSSVPTIQNQHHFGCPTYVLKKELQDHKKIRKWSERTRVGINLGYSSRHALNVSLILNLQTGLVSPQYHCQYDDLFETTTGTQARSIPTS